MTRIFGLRPAERRASQARARPSELARAPGRSVSPPLPAPKNPAGYFGGSGSGLVSRPTALRVGHGLSHGSSCYSPFFTRRLGLIAQRVFPSRGRIRTWPVEVPLNSPADADAAAACDELSVAWSCLDMIVRRAALASRPPLCRAYLAIADLAASIFAFTASRLKLAPFCMGGNSIAVIASFSTCC